MEFNAMKQYELHVFNQGRLLLSRSFYDPIEEYQTGTALVSRCSDMDE